MAYNYSEIESFIKTYDSKSNDPKLEKCIIQITGKWVSNHENLKLKSKDGILSFREYIVRLITENIAEKVLKSLNVDSSSVDKSKIANLEHQIQEVVEKELDFDAFCNGEDIKTIGFTVNGSSVFFNSQSLQNVVMQNIPRLLASYDPSYISSIYNQMISQNNNQGPDDEKKQSSTAVSSMSGKAISSSYIPIKWNWHGKRDEFVEKCNRIIFSLAYYDANRNNSELKKLLDKHFLEALAFCNSEEELETLKNLLQALASVGGIAVDFFKTYGPYINKRAHDDACQILKNHKPQDQKQQIITEYNALNEELLNWYKGWHDGGNLVSSEECNGFLIRYEQLKQKLYGDGNIATREMLDHIEDAISNLKGIYSSIGGAENMVQQI